MSFEIGFDPVIVRLGPLALAWHGIFSALAVAVAVWLGASRARRRGVTGDKLSTLVVWALVGGVIGARLFHVLDHLRYYADNPFEIPAIWSGGIAVYGGFLGGVAGGILAARRLGLPVWTLLDAAAPAMLVGQAIGRLGCLANGDAWGGPCSCATCVCVRYTHPDALLPARLRGVPTHPYPLYEIAAELVLLLALWALRRKLRAPGALFLSVVAGYGVIRFFLSYFRQEPEVLWGLQEAQVIALATGVAAAGLLLAGRLRPRAPQLTAGLPPGGGDPS
jgi:phosphatidylglycerol:prolipoprotein diacylglycerol transferase